MLIDSILCEHCEHCQKSALLPFKCLISSDASPKCQSKYDRIQRHWRMFLFEVLVNNRPCLFSDHFLISAQLVVAIKVRVIYKDKRRGWVRHCGKVTLTHGTIRISPMHYSLPRFSTTNTQALPKPPLIRYILQRTGGTAQMYRRERVLYGRVTNCL